MKKVKNLISASTRKALQKINSIKITLELRTTKLAAVIILAACAGCMSSEFDETVQNNSRESPYVNKKTGSYRPQYIPPDRAPVYRNPSQIPQYPAPYSSYYSNPYAVPSPGSPYYGNFDSDQNYVVPNYYQNVEPQERQDFRSNRY